MIKNILFVFLLLLGPLTYGQSDQEKAREKGRTAVKLMDNGKVDEAIKLLEEARKLDPECFDYPYETAYALYVKQDFKGAIKTLEKLENHKDRNDLLYQLLGNSYDNIGKQDKAMAVYAKGLELFPGSGPLYLEQGIIMINNKEYDSALSFFEKGIYADPDFPSNYFHATRLYLSSTEKMWGMIYGEIFMNLERNSKRTMTISKLLYDTYKSQITFPSDSTVSVSFSKQMTINIEDLSDTSALKLPYGMIYVPTLLLSIADEKEIDMNSLDRIRTSFVISYFNKDFSKSYPNALFDYQKKVMDAGHLEAYNHWILMKGNDDEFDKWYVSNKGKWDSFIKWFSDNGISLSADNRFYSGQY